MHRKLFRTSQIVIEDKYIKLEYNLVSDRIQNNTIYGLEVIKYSEDEEERHFLPSLTSSAPFIQSILDFLSKHNVTPCTVDDVLQDLMQEMVLR
jgi:hypothetical protein